MSTHAVFGLVMTRDSAKKLVKKLGFRTCIVHFCNTISW